MKSRITQKRKYLVKEIEISNAERHLPFEIVLPKHVHKVTGIIITVNKS